MPNTFDTEKLLIALLVEKISLKMRISTPEEWQQRDFENLNILVEDKTGVNLSVSTLKRIWKQQFANLPQKNTLNALASFLGYKDWFDFKTAHEAPTQSGDKQFPKKVRGTFLFLKKSVAKLVYIPVSVVVVILILLMVFKTEPGQSYTEAHFSSRKTVSEGVPNSVIFDYDISKFDVDSAFIQQSWDRRRRARINKHEKYSSSQYYYPGYHLAKLIINKQLVKEIPVYITTKSWLSVITNPVNQIIPVYVKENCINSGQIYISPEQVKDYNIGLESNNHNTSFYYVNENFYGDSDNFTFETSIKNSLEEGATTCQFCTISIFAESGRHYVTFCDPGCVSQLSLKFGKKYIMGSNNDLSAFGTDMNQWNDVKIAVKNSLVEVSLNGVVIYQSEVEKSNGKIKGVYYNFGGCGAIDYARLYDGSSNLIFAEDF